MKNSVKRILLLLSKKLYAIYIFLKENGFFDELIRGIVKLLFFVIVFGIFKEAVW